MDIAQVEELMEMFKEQLEEELTVETIAAKSVSADELDPSNRIKPLLSWSIIINIHQQSFISHVISQLKYQQA